MITNKDSKQAAADWFSLAAGAPETRRLNLERLERELRALDDEQAPEAMRLIRHNRSELAEN
jgi:hypothetical protein